jgi:hypothetical protein
MKSSLNNLIDELSREATREVNLRQGQPEWKDQSGGNQCHALTFHVMDAMRRRFQPVRRELHRDEYGNWHYMLVHEAMDADPTDNDLVTDFNPWQWKHDRTAKGLIHAPRNELIERLRHEDAPEYVIALRGLDTITKHHEPNMNFGGHMTA